MSNLYLLTYLSVAPIDYKGTVPSESLPIVPYAFVTIDGKSIHTRTEYIYPVCVLCTGPNPYPFTIVRPSDS